MENFWLLFFNHFFTLYSEHEKWTSSKTGNKNDEKTERIDLIFPKRYIRKKIVQSYFDNTTTVLNIELFKSVHESPRRRFHVFSLEEKKPCNFTSRKRKIQFTGLKNYMEEELYPEIQLVKSSKAYHSFSPQPKIQIDFFSFRHPPILQSHQLFPP